MLLVPTRERHGRDTAVTRPSLQHAELHSAALDVTTRCPGNTVTVLPATLHLTRATSTMQFGRVSATSRMQFVWVNATTMQFVWVNATSRMQFVWVSATSTMQCIWVNPTSTMQFVWVNPVSYTHLTLPTRSLV